jgi:hypothetical protein
MPFRKVPKGSLSDPTVPTDIFCSTLITLTFQLTMKSLKHFLSFCLLFKCLWTDVTNLQVFPGVVACMLQIWNWCLLEVRSWSGETWSDPQKLHKLTKSIQARNRLETNAKLWTLLLKSRNYYFPLVLLWNWTISVFFVPWRLHYFREMPVTEPKKRLFAAYSIYLGKYPFWRNDNVPVPKTPCNIDEVWWIVPLKGIWR